ncbi:hypothetical protein [Streptomyces venezuelae]|uniref:hypothetical protein n=1 Tax=Streptomyces venezuelae TaxID=54571 RepID=UPI0016804C23|nr:hypothetical protein [Streptomyces venezuelae]
MSKTSRRLTTAIFSTLLGGALYINTGIGWDVAPASAAPAPHGSVVSNGIGWD